jgi:hypothetical protein
MKEGREKTEGRGVRKGKARKKNKKQKKVLIYIYYQRAIKKTQLPVPSEERGVDVVPLLLLVSSLSSTEREYREQDKRKERPTSDTEFPGGGDDEELTDDDQNTGDDFDEERVGEERQGGLRVQHAVENHITVDGEGEDPESDGITSSVAVSQY